VENAVLLVERWILARLRHHTFFSLRELNAAIADLLTELNTKPFKLLPGCRKEKFGVRAKCQSKAAAMASLRQSTLTLHSDPITW